MLAVAVIIGAVIGGGIGNMGALAIALIPPIFIGAASFAINDYFDAKADRLNKRADRPIVKGDVKASDAHTLSIILFFIGVAASFFVNLVCFIIALTMSILAYLYSYRLKDFSLIGNIYVASTMAVPFVYGNLAFSGLSASVVLLACIAFTAGIGREITLTMRDVEGDRKARGAKTLPMIIGMNCSALLASFMYIYSILLAFLPFFFIDAYKGDVLYLVPIAAASTILLRITLSILNDKSRKLLQFARGASLLALCIGLAGFLLGSIF